MDVQQNIKKVTQLTSCLEKHPCCFDHEWDDVGRLIVYFPEGYSYGVARGLRLNEKNKSECLEKAIMKLEKVWELNSL